MATIEVAEAEELAGEAEEVDVVPAVVNKDNNSKRNRRTPRSIKARCIPQFVKSVGRLATLQISVGAYLHKLVVIHLGVVSPSS